MIIMVMIVTFIFITDNIVTGRRNNLTLMRFSLSDDVMMVVIEILMMVVFMMNIISIFWGVEEGKATCITCST